MRRHVATALLAVAIVGGAVASAGAANGKPKTVRIVKHEGALTATLTYTQNGPAAVSPVLVIRRNGKLLLRQPTCPARRDEVCGAVIARPFLRFRQISASAPKWAVFVDGYTGSIESFIAVVSRHPRSFVHDWGRDGFREQRVDGRFYFVSGDKRFMCTLTSCADSRLPAQIWAIRSGTLVDVTRSVPAFIRANARHQWKGYLTRGGRGNHLDRGVGFLAAWCADKYMLGEGATCQQTLRKELALGYLDSEIYRGPRLIRTVNAHLRRWGYSVPMFAPCYGAAQVRPRSITVACGDGDFFVTRLRWSHWTRTSATARGLGHLNTHGAFGHFHTFAVSLQLHRPERCTGNRWLFTRFTVRYLHAPPKYAGRRRYTLEAPFYAGRGCP